MVCHSDYLRELVDCVFKKSFILFFVLFSDNQSGFRWLCTFPCDCRLFNLLLKRVANSLRIFLLGNQSPGLFPSIDSFLVLSSMYFVEDIFVDDCWFSVASLLIGLNIGFTFSMRLAVTERVVIVRYVQIVQSSSFPHPRLSRIFNIKSSLQILLFNLCQQRPLYLTVRLNLRKVIQFNTLKRSTEIFYFAQIFRPVLLYTRQTLYHLNQLT